MMGVSCKNNGSGFVLRPVPRLPMYQRGRVPRAARVVVCSKRQGAYLATFLTVSNASALLSAGILDGVPFSTPNRCGGTKPAPTRARRAIFDMSVASHDMKSNEAIAASFITRRLLFARSIAWRAALRLPKT